MSPAFEMLFERVGGEIDFVNGVGAMVFVVRGWSRVEVA